MFDIRRRRINHGHGWTITTSAVKQHRKNEGLAFCCIFLSFGSTALETEITFVHIIQCQMKR